MSANDTDQFGQDDIIEYMENDYFHKNDPDPDDVLEFASYKELKVTNEPTEEMKDRYREYVRMCVEWTLCHMSIDDEFTDLFTDAAERPKWASDYDMFTASIRDFLDRWNADKEFGKIKEMVIDYRVYPSGHNISVANLMESMFAQNTPLDSHIIADTDYLRQYLETCPDIILDELDVVLNERRPENAEEIVKAINDANDPLFDKIVDRIVEKALENDRLHDKLADAVHGSWLWEQLSNMCDDVAVGFMHKAARETLNEMGLKK